jgi:SAM-dependent methyltransferase
MAALKNQLQEAIEPMPQSVLQRYRECRDWTLFEKEYVFHNFPPAGLRWLDFGCGTGVITSQLALLGAERVIAIEINPELVAMTKARAQVDGVADRITAYCADIMSVTPEPVDIVFSNVVLHHVPDRFHEVIPALKRWLRPGGKLVCIEPVASYKGVEYLRQHSGIPSYPLDEGERKLTEDDLRAIESHFEWSHRQYFRVLNRVERFLPETRSLRRGVRMVDRRVLQWRWMHRMAGTVVLSCGDRA